MNQKKNNKKTKILFIVSILLYCLLHPAIIFAAGYEEYYQKGQKSYQAGNHQEAVKFLEKSIELNPNFAPSYNTLGLVNHDRRAPLSEVVWYFKVAIDIDPSYVEAYHNLGKVYQQAGEVNLAEKYLRKTLNLSPDLISAQFALAWVYLLGKSQPNDAIYYFSKVLEKSEIPQAYYGLGLAYSMLEDHPMVLELVTKLREIGENDLAAQLEEKIRKPFNPKTPEVLPEPEPQYTQPRPAPPRTKQSIDGGVMRVRMRGKLINNPPDN